MEENEECSTVQGEREKERERGIEREGAKTNQETAATDEGGLGGCVKAKRVK